MKVQYCNWPIDSVVCNTCVAPVLLCRRKAQTLLAIMNVWADVLSVVIIILVIGFCVFQIGGNYITGRFQRKRFGKLWPKHKEIIPILPRALHALHAVSIVVLGISGISIRFPISTFDYETIIKIHYIFMYPVVITFILRIYYAIIKDSHEFRINSSEIHHSIKVILYYAFVKSSYPHLAKYNVFQKTTYAIFFPFLMIVLSVSGFSLMWPKVFLGLFTIFLGSLPTTIALALLIHWVAAVSIIATTIVHACLAVLEDYPALLVFFGISKQQGVAKNENPN